MADSLRILAIDDEEPLLQMLRKFLTRQMHTVTAINRAHEALNWFREHSNEIDLAIIDLSMPEMPGEELALAMFTIRPDIPILLSSGYPFDVEVLPPAVRPFVGFLGKPYLPRELEAAIRSLLP